MSDPENPPVLRFMVFVGEDYYPRINLRDFKSSFDAKDEAERFAKECVCGKRDDWWTILDRETGEFTDDDR